MLHNTAITIMCAFRDIRYHVDVTSTPVTLIVPYINAVFRWRTQSVDIGGHVAGSVKRKHPVEIITSSHHIMSYTKWRCFESLLNNLFSKYNFSFETSGK